MDPFNYSDIWIRFMWQSPQFVILLVGVVMAMVTMGRHAGRSLCALIAFLGLLLTSVGVQLFWEFGFEGLMESTLDPDFVDVLLRGASIAPNVLYPIWFLLLVIAVFGGRRYVSQPPLTASAAPAPAEPVALEAADAYTTSLAPQTQMPAGAPAGSKPVGRLSKAFYLGSMIGGVILTWLLLIPGLILIYSDRGHDAPAGLLFVCASYLPMFYVLIVALVLVHKMWAAIQDGPARTTPGKAVGFLFIPLFNLYWIFQAYWGWMVDYNLMVESRQLSVPRMPEGLALTLCILSLCSIIPVIGILIGLVSFVLALMFLNSAIDGVNRLAAISGGVETSTLPT
jgi:hypothetical protein